MTQIKSNRIYGIDPGCIKDIEIIKNMSELDLYLNIDALGGHIWWCQHEMSHDRIKKIDLTEEQYALEYMVYQTTRFGIELEKPSVNKHIAPTPSYRAWFQFFDNHFKHGLTNEQWQAFQEAYKNDQDISAFMPTGNWKDLLEQSIQKKLK